MGDRSTGSAARGSLACAGVAALWLAACVPTTRAPESSRPVPGSAPPTAVAASSPETRRPDAVVYDVLPGQSELRVLVYRGGPLARLGHNHVLATRELTGTVHLPTDGAGLRFDVSFPVASFALDEPQARAAEGPEFESVPTPADVEGTRRNLESPQVLDAARHPSVTLRGLGATGGPEAWRVRVDVELRAARHAVEAPARVERHGDALVARGEFVLRQSELGLTPFSVAMGALQVRDELTIRYVLTARRR